MKLRDFKDYVKSFLIHTCIYCTVAYSAVMLFFAAFLKETVNTPFAVITYFLILGFCAFFALANIIFAKANISVWWRAVIHVVLTLGGFYVCIVRRFADIGTNQDTLVLFTVVSTVLYGISFGTFLTVRYIVIRKQEEKVFQKRASLSLKDQKRR